MSLDVHAMAIETERTLLSTQNERTRQIAEASTVARRQGPSTADRGRWTVGTAWGRLDMRLWRTQRERTLSGPTGS